MIKLLVALGFLLFVGLASFGLAAAAARGDSQARRRALEALDFEVMLWAIAQVESGNNPKAPGKLGERGRCQFREATWREYTTAPFHLWAAIDCELTRKVERAHLLETCNRLLDLGLALEPALVASAWRFGAGQAARFVRADSSRRAANLYFDRVNRAAEVSQ